VRQQLLQTVILFAIYFSFTSIAYAQDVFNGLVVTEEDSVIRGYLRISLDGQHGKKIEITKNKKVKPQAFYTYQLKYYAFKRDTFAMLNSFYPFKGEDYKAERVEAKIIVRKGKVKLYEAILPGYVPRGANNARATEYNRVSGGDAKNPSRILLLTEYKTYILKDSNGELFGVFNPYYKAYVGGGPLSFKGHEKFVKSVEEVFIPDTELMDQIRKKEFKYDDLPEIVRIFNSRH
jgi:hypothetical protein